MRDLDTEAAVRTLQHGDRAVVVAPAVARSVGSMAVGIEAWAVGFYHQPTLCLGEVACHDDGDVCWSSICKRGLALIQQQI